MKLSNNQNNQTIFQKEFSFPKINTGLVIVLACLIVVACMTLLFPLLALSQELEPRIAIQATEHTATIEFVTQDNTATSDTFTLDINVDPGGQAINAVGIFIGFASTSVTALEINIDNSFCDFFIDTSIDQEAGEISIFCGKPYPGVATTSNIAQITFQKDVLGLSNIEVKQNSLVLANDGFGTNILKELTDIDILLN